MNKDAPQRLAEQTERCRGLLQLVIGLRKRVAQLEDENDALQRRVKRHVRKS